MFKKLIIAISTTVLAATALIPQPALAQSIHTAAANACFQDDINACPSIGAVSIKHDTTSLTSTNGLSKAALGWKTLNFTINTDSSNAGRLVWLQFFDLNGASMSLNTGNGSAACQADLAAGLGCQQTLDSNGDSTFVATFAGITEGAQVKYQFNGPAGYTSAFNTLKFTANYNGTGPVPTDACYVDSPNVCTNPAKLTLTQGTRKITVTNDADGIGAGRAATTSTAIKFKYTSDASNAGLGLYVQLFDVKGATLSLPTSQTLTSTACLQAASSGGGCQLTLDAKGGASFTATLNGASAGSSFRYQINAPTYASKYVQVDFGALANATVKLAKRTITVTLKNLAAAPTTIAISGSKAVVKTPNAASVAYTFKVKPGTRVVTITAPGFSTKVSLKVK